MSVRLSTTEPFDGLSWNSVVGKNCKAIVIFVKIGSVTIIVYLRASWIFTCNFHISLQACVRRGIRDVVMPLSHCEFRENRHGGRCTLLKLLNDNFCSVFNIFCPIRIKLGYIYIYTYTHTHTQTNSSRGTISLVKFDAAKGFIYGRKQISTLFSVFIFP